MSNMFSRYTLPLKIVEYAPTVMEPNGAHVMLYDAKDEQLACMVLRPFAEAIIYAANAHPQLIEALRDLIHADNISADTDHAGPFGAALDPARSLLRKLGENA